MNESRDDHTKRNQTKTNIGYHLYVESLKKKIPQANLFTKKKKTDFKNKFMATKRVGVNWRDKLEYWDGSIHTTIYKIDD